MVYVVQQHTKRDAEGKIVPKYDLTPAKKFGELKYLLSSREKPNPTRVIPLLKTGLLGFTEDDFLLLIGNPLFIAWAGALAMIETGGKVRALLWDRRAQDYVCVEAEL